MGDISESHADMNSAWRVAHACGSIAEVKRVCYSNGPKLTSCAIVHCVKGKVSRGGQFAGAAVDRVLQIIM